MIRSLYAFFLTGLVLCVTGTAHASESSGTIDTSFKNAKVCHSVGCVTPAPGVINFRPTGTTPVTIDDTLGVDGIAWGNELGWITFDPTGPEGVTINTTTGVLAGKGWSQVSGWINFAPTGQSVTINSSGEFTGWAWTGGPQGGWIKFDCADGAACVKTDWRPLGSRTVVTPGGGGGGNGPVTGSSGGGGSPSDMCWNISGIQFEVPLGYSHNGGNTCQVTSDTLATATTTDACLNIGGTQTVVPAGYTRDTGGLCIPVQSSTTTTDTDGDGILDSLEPGDSDQDSVPDYIESNIRDTDGDSLPNHLDPDDDGDGYPTLRERTATTDQQHTDFDGDGIASYLDAIFNGVKKPTPKSPTPTQVPPVTTVPDPTPLAPNDAPFAEPLYTPPVSLLEQEGGNAIKDNDADGIPDSQDPVVAPYTALRGGDSDGDGMTDADECPTGYPCLDDDSDGVANYLDPQPSSGAPLEQPNQQSTTEQTSQLNTDIVHLAFVPPALHIPVNAPAFREALRAVVGNSITQTLLADPAPGADIKVDAVSIVAVVGAGAVPVFAVVYGLLRVLGLLAFFI